jgi:hypothetical protein
MANSEFIGFLVKLFHGWYTQRHYIHSQKKNADRGPNTGGNQGAKKTQPLQPLLSNEDPRTILCLTQKSGGIAYGRKTSSTKLYSGKGKHFKEFNETELTNFFLAVLSQKNHPPGLRSISLWPFRLGKMFQLFRRQSQPILPIFPNRVDSYLL